MVRSVAIIGLALSPTAAAMAQPANAPINLMCVGTALKDETVGGALDLLAGNGRSERIATEDSLFFTIASDNSGAARLPRRLQSGYKEANKDGSFRLIEVARSDTEITGKVRLHSMNKMRFRLDRLTGTVTVNGPLGDFSGRCEPYDPATVQRKF